MKPNIENAPYKTWSLYIAVVLYESSSDAPDDKPLYEECFLVVRAKSDEEARERAMQLVSAPHSYKNQYGATITWSFKEIERVQSVLSDELADGKELYARYFLDYGAYHATFLTPFPED